MLSAHSRPQHNIITRRLGPEENCLDLNPDFIIYKVYDLERSPKFSMVYTIAVGIKLGNICKVLRTLYF